MWFYRTDDTYFIYVILLYLWLVNINQIRYTIFIRKGGERMDEMTDKELITILIDKYTDLQRIKKQTMTPQTKSLIIKSKQPRQNYLPWILMLKIWPYKKQN